MASVSCGVEVDGGTCSETQTYQDYTKRWLGLYMHMLVLTASIAEGTLGEGRRRDLQEKRHDRCKNCDRRRFGDSGSDLTSTCVFFVLFACRRLNTPLMITCNLVSCYQKYSIGKGPWNDLPTSRDGSASEDYGTEVKSAAPIQMEPHTLHILQPWVRSER